MQECVSLCADGMRCVNVCIWMCIWMCVRMTVMLAVAVAVMMMMMMCMDVNGVIGLVNVSLTWLFFSLLAAGTKKRLGFRKKTTTSFSVHRSEEIAPQEVRHLVKQASSASSEGEGSISGDSAAQ